MRAAQVSEVGTEVQVGSVEVGAPPGMNLWWMCCVEKEELPNRTLPQYSEFATKMQNQFQGLSEDDDENECHDCMSWPVVGKGSKVNKGAKRGLGKRAKDQKF